mmetsp:Transcript_9188/g.17528  ORF Transcript_9188/g.17528 Transcript_9188/m.17528 type:complete len:116 (+) Transcript_9188:75-422(+)
MPLKFNKEVSTQLFKYVTTIDLKFNPLDNRTTSVRELLRQLRAKRFIKANPKLAIKVDVHNRPAAPSAHFQFVDGTDQLFETKDYNAHEMMFQIHLKGMQLDAEYEMAGKSVDEV